MKRIILLVITLICFTFVLEGKVNIQQAKKVANTFLQQKDSSQKIETVKEGRSNNYYIFELEDEGFVITSTEKSITPIIAYSFKHTLVNDDELFTMIENDLNLREEYYLSTSNNNFANEEKWDELLSGNILVQRDFQQWPSHNSTSTDGWVEARWNQSGIYNQFCPIDNGGNRSVVGCVATAMAMIVDFHKYVGELSFNSSDSFSSGYGYPQIHIDADHEDNDFPSFEELNGYLDILDTHYETNTPLTSQDKGALSFACGIAVEMNYASDGSGAYTQDVPSALINKFDFDTGYWVNEGYNLLSNLANEMKHMRPSAMSIHDSNYESGHAIICDGYNTDDYFHLNFGWGTSNSTCWYSLPQGMPSGYSIISGVSMGIEGGLTPVSVTGEVNGCPDPVGTIIQFEGATPFTFEITSTSGDFEIFALLPGMYTVTATNTDRAYYQTFDIFISSANNIIEFNLGEYSAFSGNIVSETDLENTYVSLYNSNNNLLLQSITDETGSFSFPNIFPGDYHLVASKVDGYFGIQDFTLDLENQSTNVELTHFTGNSNISYSEVPSDIFSLPQEFTLTCAIQLTDDELINHESNAISGVKFKSPIDSENGEIYAQVWEEGVLISEKEVTDLVKGNWYSVEFNNYAELKSGYDYYVGYKIHTLTGEAVYHDDTPKFENKSTYIRTNDWTLLSSTLDFNFCIDATILNNNYGTVTGNISSSIIDDLQFNDMVVKAGHYTTHPDENGNFSLDLYPDTYIIEVSANQNINAISEEFTIEADQVIVQDFSLTDNNSDSVNASVDNLIGNYPNPFNPTTTIKFEIKNDTHVKLNIYNIKGQLIKSLINKKIESGIHSIEWNGTDDCEKSVSSGFYLYGLETSTNAIFKKALLLK